MFQVADPRIISQAWTCLMDWPSHHTRRTRWIPLIPADSCDGLCAGLSARHQRYRSLCPL